MTQHHHHKAAPVLAGRRLMTTREYRHVMGNPSQMKLWRDEQRGVGPKPVRINGRRFWLANEVFTYLDELAASRNGQSGDAASEGEAKNMEVHQHGST